MPATGVRPRISGPMGLAGSDWRDPSEWNQGQPQLCVCECGVCTSNWSGAAASGGSSVQVTAAGETGIQGQLLGRLRV